MTVFIVVPLTKSNTQLDNAVKENIPSADRHKLQSERGWLVKFNGTTVELSNHIKLTGQEPGIPSPVGSAIVVPISSYYGRGPSEMWEWLKNRLEQ